MADAVAVRGAILSTGYQSNDIKVEWDVGDFHLTVRPPNMWSRLVWDVSLCGWRGAKDRLPGSLCLSYSSCILSFGYGSGPTRLAEEHTMSLEHHVRHAFSHFSRREDKVTANQ